MPSRCGNSRFIIILGMHRSGTSALAGSLQQHGLCLGQVHEWNPHNQKGNRESQQVMELNDAVLSLNDAAWDKPPTETLKWDSEVAERRDEILYSLSSIGSACGFKDPRTLITLDFWLDAAEDFQLIGTFRHPLAVAKSLKARSGMQIDQGLFLWSVYNASLLQKLQQVSFPLVCFDAPAIKYQKDLQALYKSVGLTELTNASDGGSRSFFEHRLRHQESTIGSESYRHALLKECLSLYQKLKAHYLTQNL